MEIIKEITNIKKDGSYNMKQIRYGTFETNSSSTHSLVICTEQDYKDWESGKILLNKWPHGKNLPRFVTYEQAIKYIKDQYNGDIPSNKEDLDELLAEYEFETVEVFENNELEWYDEHFKTPSGDNMVVFGQYGYNG